MERGEDLGSRRAVVARREMEDRADIVAKEREVVGERQKRGRRRKKTEETEKCEDCDCLQHGKRQGRGRGMGEIKTAIRGIHKGNRIRFIHITEHNR